MKTIYLYFIKYLESIDIGHMRYINDNKIIAKTDIWTNKKKITKKDLKYLINIIYELKNESI